MASPLKPYPCMPLQITGRVRHPSGQKDKAKGAGQVFILYCMSFCGDLGHKPAKSAQYRSRMPYTDPPQPPHPRPIVCVWRGEARCSPPHPHALRKLKIRKPREDVGGPWPVTRVPLQAPPPSKTFATAQSDLDFCLISFLVSSIFHLLLFTPPNTRTHSQNKNTHACS